MTDRRWIALFAALVALVTGWNLTTYTVPQWQQAIVLQLGEPVRTVQKPGLYFKLPMVQNVVYFDKRLLAYDAAPREVLTKDKQQLVVDNFSRWRIVDPLLAPTSPVHLYEPRSWGPAEAEALAPAGWHEPGPPQCV